MSSRTDLHKILVNLLGSENVYYNPPTSKSMSYPAIRYSKETIDSLNKLNLTYFETSKYGSIIFDLKSGTKTYYMP